MLKRYAIAFSIALLGVGFILFYYWQRATQLPSWYTEQSASTDSTQQLVPPDSTQQPSSSPSTQQSRDLSPSAQKEKPQIQKEQESVDAKIVSSVKKTSAGKQVEVQLNQQEISSLFTSELKRKTESKTLAKAIKGVNTTVQNGRIESGAVVNLGSVSVKEMSSNERSFVTKLIQTFPALGDRNVYVGLEGKPTVVNGQVMLGEDTRIKIGDLSFTASELSQRLGIPEDQIRNRINLEIQLGKLRASDIQLEGDRAVVRGAAD
jgi:hypothetical protein